MSYWIQPGTTSVVSRHCAPFEPHTTTNSIIFEQPAEEIHDAMIFANGTWRILVDQAHVWLYESNGVGGTNQRGD